MASGEKKGKGTFASLTSTQTSTAKKKKRKGAEYDRLWLGSMEDQYLEKEKEREEGRDRKSPPYFYSLVEDSHGKERVMGFR